MRGCTLAIHPHHLSRGWVALETHRGAAASIAHATWPCRAGGLRRRHRGHAHETASSRWGRLPPGWQVGGGGTGGWLRQRAPLQTAASALTTAHAAAAAAGTLSVGQRPPPLGFPRSMRVFPQVARKIGLGRRVDITSRLVQKKHTRLAQQQPRKRLAHLPPATQLSAPCLPGILCETQPPKNPGNARVLVVPAGSLKVLRR